MRLLLLVVGALGCARGAAGVPDGPPADAAPGSDAIDYDAPDAAPSAANHLLLTEVVLDPTTAELVEIANPTDHDISLAQYYLSDSASYFRLPANTVTVDSGDFIVRFPNQVIASHAVLTVAIDTAANFQSVYGAAPTYSIASHTMTTFVATGTPTLANTGEPIVLFHWDGASDLVDDVDIVIAGAPTATNLLTDKSGVAIDGPDTGSTPTAYKADARTLAAQASAPGTGLSTKRIAVESTHEIGSGGNGITGHDETSENTALTWDTAFTAPTPGTVPTTVIP